MLNKELIFERTATMRASINRLKEFRKITQEEFLADADNYAIAEHHFRRALECLFDIGRHIVVKKGLGYPEDYRSIIELLGQKGILPPAFAQKIIGMAGYRNRLVHGYAEVTGEEMYKLIKTKLEDFEEFVEYVFQMMQDKNG